MSKHAIRRHFSTYVDAFNRLDGAELANRKDP